MGHPHGVNKVTKTIPAFNRRHEGDVRLLRAVVVGGNVSLPDVARRFHCGRHFVCLGVNMSNGAACAYV